MKNIFFLITALIFSISANAQTSKTAHTMHHAKTQNAMKDCVMMKDGKMMMMKNGKMMDMDKDMTMSDGTICMKDGTCKMKNGTAMMMKEGDKCYMDGKMGKMKMDKTGK
ncbi:MAG TPA: DUF6799 domain-containing protein [Chitinophagaceae bacterium]|nr:DUF6799 domain-containing protein [Chitinophagaceae bacterium]